MANFLPQHRDELKKGLAAVAEDLSVMIGTNVNCTVTKWNLSPVADYLASFDPFAVCCRSRYMKNACGVGGFLFPPEGARMIAASLLFMD